MQLIRATDEIESSNIRALHSYWRSKFRGEKLPRRADIDPAEIPRLVPRLMVVDVEQKPFRVRYRLVGTKVVEMTGFEFTGKYLDEIALPNDEGPFLECYQKACDTRSAVITRIKWRLEPDTVAEYDVCFLPLSDDGETVNKVLSMECYESVERDYTLGRGRDGQTTASRRIP